MSDLSNIDSERIISAARELDVIVGRMDGCVKKFTNAVTNLDKGWISEVKDSFMANYQLDQDAMLEMISQLREINDGLRDAAGDFDKTESEIGSSIKSLRW